MYCGVSAAQGSGGNDYGKELLKRDKLRQQQNYQQHKQHK
mgnify:CR=1 FL=1